MAPQFNAAQQAIIEREWELATKAFGLERPKMKRSRNAAVSCAMVGPFISSQEIGKYFTNRAAAAAGRPRATRKTPEQLEMLQTSFGEDPFPTTFEMIFLVHRSGLTRKQVQHWFVNERKKYDGDLMTTNQPNDACKSAKLWREYTKDPEAFVEKYLVEEPSDEEQNEEQDEDDE